MDYEVIEIDCACIIQNKTKGEYGDVPEALVHESLKTYGTVILRGWEGDVYSFGNYVKNMSARTSLDPKREFFGDTAQKVDAGLSEVGLHIENGNNPLDSNTCWFYCETPASVRSQTTYCDGKKVWELFPQNLKYKFLNKKLIYTRNVNHDVWKKFVSFTTGISLEDVTYRNLKDIFTNTNVKVLMNNDNSVYYEYTLDAVTKIKDYFAFSNSILGPSYNYEKPKIYLDGIELSNALIKEIERYMKAVTYEIEWEKNDIAIIDNIRVMHGRNRIEDSNRSIYNALSDIKELV